MSDEPREFTADEARWVRRLKRTFDDMPETLRGFHSPGSISFADRDDDSISDADIGALGRQEGIIGSISSPALNRIGEGDW